MYPLRGMKNITCQTRLLPGVSRTFALTIPQLPDTLRDVVTNAYLLCRIADTIEDDVALDPQQKAYFHAQFRKVLVAEESSERFAESLFPKLAQDIPNPEKELIRNIPEVINCLHSFTPAQQKSLQRCVNIMSTGMPEFQRTVSLKGLENLVQLDQYCYYVAGVVGEMLTELFCEYSSEINKNRGQLMSLAISFGQGLQMTNILKDVWEDRSRGICWLPRDIFQEYGIDLSAYNKDNHHSAFAIPLRQLIVKAKEHLKDALHYTLMIPAYETGIRRFTLWAIGLAVLTLRNIYRRPFFQSGVEVKISRSTVKKTIFLANLSCKNNQVLQTMFNWLTRDLI